MSLPLHRTLILGALLLLAAAPGSAARDPAHEALLRAYVTAWNTGELGSLDGVLTEDFVRHGGYGSAASREELQRLIQRFRGFYRDLHIEVEDSFAGPEKGAMRWRFTGGYGTTSFEMKGLNFGMYRFADGRIAEEWVLGNTTDYWTSMGYRILPPGTKMVPPPVEDPPGLELPTPPPFGVVELAAYAEGTLLDPPKNAGRIEITTDVACRLTLDGRSVGGLAAGESIALQVERGDHSLYASSRGGSIFLRESVRVRKGQTIEVDIAAPGRVIVHPRNRTTEDLSTGLMWQLTDNGSDITQPAAAAFCQDSAQGGHTDWRLPTIHELQGIYAPEAAGTKRFHTLDGITLTGCCPWTTSPHGDFHWTFVFYNGLRYIKYKSIGKFSRALCVRFAS